MAEKKPKRSGVMTHREIAAILGITHARVQQIERAALEKIRKTAPELDPRC